MAADTPHRREAMREFTPAALVLGVIIALVMTAANVYLGLYAGMTVSASIPAAVIAMGVFRLLRRSNVLASNIVQTMASAGESLAAGIIFTVPALVIVGAWNEFRFWPTTLIAIGGGVLGVLFMIPLRRALIVEERELIYPEGVACAAVLETGSARHGAGVKDILRGLGIGGLFKFAGTGLGIISGAIEWATKIGGRAIFFGSDISPALLAVGYIVRLEVASLVFIGGAIGWLVGIPWLGSPGELAGASAAETAYRLWSEQIRYMGVGAMVVGGVWSIFTVRRGILAGLRGLMRSYAGAGEALARRERDMSFAALAIAFSASALVVFGLYEHLLGGVHMALFVTAVMLVASFLIVAIASYITGLVGSSNSPVSGMTISALFGTAGLLLIAGYRGDAAMTAVLGVAAVVCCAACTSGDISQDLKTGYLVGATPKYQQYAQIIGVVIPAFTIAPVLTLLHHSYGIGTGLKAPQAVLFASLTDALFGGGRLPYGMVFIGAALGVVVIIADLVLKARGVRFRLHLMPLAVGIYLPITLGTPILLGGIIRMLAERPARHAENGNEATDRGVLLSSGLIAGEAIMGVLLAAVIALRIDLRLRPFGEEMASLIGAAAFLTLAAYMFRTGKARS